jgi:hypothetical protein
LNQWGARCARDGCGSGCTLCVSLYALGLAPVGAREICVCVCVCVFVCVMWVPLARRVTPRARVPRRKPTSRHGDGVSLRNLPAAILTYLDRMLPLEGGARWKSCAISAITQQHQFTGFDCGVACLLYLEKIAQGFARQDIRQWTDQSEISEFRALLMDFLNTVRE